MHTEFGWVVPVSPDDCTPEIATDTAGPQVPLDVSGLPLDNLDTWQYDCPRCHDRQCTVDGLPVCTHCGWNYTDQLHKDIARLVAELQYDKRFRSKTHLSLAEASDDAEDNDLADAQLTHQQ